MEDSDTEVFVNPYDDDDDDDDEDDGNGHGAGCVLFGRPLMVSSIDAKIQADGRDTSRYNNDGDDSDDSDDGEEISISSKSGAVGTRRVPKGDGSGFIRMRKQPMSTAKSADELQRGTVPVQPAQIDDASPQPNQVVPCSPPHSPSPPSSPQYFPSSSGASKKKDDLEEFRLKWRQELGKRTALQAGSKARATSSYHAAIMTRQDDARKRSKEGADGHAMPSSSSSSSSSSWMPTMMETTQQQQHTAPHATMVASSNDRRVTSDPDSSGSVAEPQPTSTIARLRAKERAVRGDTWHERQQQQEEARPQNIYVKLLLDDLDEDLTDPLFDALLPVEVAEIVFEYLTIDDLGICACVSRQWKELAYSNRLWFLNANRLGFNPLNLELYQMDDWRLHVKERTLSIRSLDTRWRELTSVFTAIPSHLPMTSTQMLTNLPTQATAVYTNASAVLIGNASGCIYRCGRHALKYPRTFKKPLPRDVVARRQRVATDMRSDLERTWEQQQARASRALQRHAQWWGSRRDEEEQALQDHLSAFMDEVETRRQQIEWEDELYRAEHLARRHNNNGNGQQGTNRHYWYDHDQLVHNEQFVSPTQQHRMRQRLGLSAQPPLHSHERSSSLSDPGASSQSLLPNQRNGRRRADHFDNRESTNGNGHNGNHPNPAVEEPDDGESELYTRVGKVFQKAVESVHEGGEYTLAATRRRVLGWEKGCHDERPYFEILFPQGPHGIHADVIEARSNVLVLDISQSSSLPTVVMLRDRKVVVAYPKHEVGLIQERERAASEAMKKKEEAKKNLSLSSATTTTTATTSTTTATTMTASSSSSSATASRARLAKGSIASDVGHEEASKPSFDSEHITPRIPFFDLFESAEEAIIGLSPVEGQSTCDLVAVLMPRAITIVNSKTRQIHHTIESLMQSETFPCMHTGCGMLAYGVTSPMASAVRVLDVGAASILAVFEAKRAITCVQLLSDYEVVFVGGNQGIYFGDLRTGTITQHIKDPYRNISLVRVLGWQIVCSVYDTQGSSRHARHRIYLYDRSTEKHLWYAHEKTPVQQLYVDKQTIVAASVGQGQLLGAGRAPWQHPSSASSTEETYIDVLDFDSLVGYSQDTSCPFSSVYDGLSYYDYNVELATPYDNVEPHRFG